MENNHKDFRVTVETFNKEYLVKGGVPARTLGGDGYLMIIFDRKDSENTQAHMQGFIDHDMIAQIVLNMPESEKTLAALSMRLMRKKMRSMSGDAES